MTKRLDADAGPPHLLVGVAEIRRRPGSRLEVHQQLEAHGMALPDVTVPDGAEIAFDGELESIHEGVVLTGVAQVPWSGECRRCLRQVEGVARIDIREVYETKPTDGETWPLEHDHVDLGPLLHDVALLALPLAPLCDDGCLGPDPERFPATVVDDGDADAEPAKDPRWAALDDLEM